MTLQEPWKVTAQQELAFLPTENLKVQKIACFGSELRLVSHTHTALVSQNPLRMPTCMYLYTLPSSRRPWDPVECLSQSLPSRLPGLLGALLQDTVHDPCRASYIPSPFFCKLCC